MLISLLHATRAMPERALATRREWLNKATHPEFISHIFGIQSDDHTSLDAFQSAGVNYACGEPPPTWASSSVANWNAAAKACLGDLLVIIADDLTPPDGWDDELRKLPPPSQDYACHVADTFRDDDLICHPILSRALYEKRGYVFHPGFYGVFCDNDFTLRTSLETTIHKLPSLKWRHDHPLAGTRPEDDIVKLQNTQAAFEYGVQMMSRLWPFLEIFNDLRANTDDLNAHMPILAKLARKCSRVTEFGSGISTISFLHALSNKNASLRSYDLSDSNKLFDACRHLSTTDWTFTERAFDDLPAIEQTDFLFIDILRTGYSLEHLLERHAARSNKFLVLFGTESIEEAFPKKNFLSQWHERHPEWMDLHTTPDKGGLSAFIRL